MDYYYKYFKYKNKYIELKNQIDGGGPNSHQSQQLLNIPPGIGTSLNTQKSEEYIELPGLEELNSPKKIVDSTQLENEKYYKPFGLYGLNGHIKKRKVDYLNERKKNFFPKNPRLPNNEINYIHELPIFRKDDNKFEDNIIIEHLLKHCKNNKYYQYLDKKTNQYKDIKSFQFIKHDNILEDESNEVQNYINKIYLVEEMKKTYNQVNNNDKDKYNGELDWMTINMYKKGRYHGLNPKLSEEYLNLYSQNAKKILEKNTYIIENNKELTNIRNKYLNLQKDRTCINIHTIPTPPEFTSIEGCNKKIILENEFIELGKKQYLLSDFKLGMDYHFNPNIFKDSYIVSSPKLGESGYNIMINKAAIACIALNSDMLFPIRILLNMNPNTLFYENIYERKYLEFILKLKDTYFNFINIDEFNSLLQFINDNKKIVITNNNQTLNNNEIDIFLNNIINTKEIDIDKIGIVENIIINRYDEINKLIKLLFILYKLKLKINNNLSLNNQISNIFNYIFMIFFNEQYKYLGFWLLRYKNNPYESSKYIEKNPNLPKFLFDTTKSKTHYSREQYYIFFTFKDINFSKNKIMYGLYPNINFRNNKIDVNTVVELKKILYHEISQLLCLYYDKKIYFYIILKNNQYQSLNCNLQNEYLNNDKNSYYNCVNAWFSTESEEIIKKLNMGIDDNQIHVLVSKNNINEIKNKKKYELKNEYNINYLIINNNYNLFECYFDYEILERKDRFVIKLGNNNESENIKDNFCINNELKSKYFDFEKERRIINYSLNILNINEEENFKINNK